MEMAEVVGLTTLLMIGQTHSPRTLTLDLCLRLILVCPCHLRGGFLHRLALWDSLEDRLLLPAVGLRILIAQHLQCPRSHKHISMEAIMARVTITANHSRAHTVTPVRLRIMARLVIITDRSRGPVTTIVGKTVTTTVVDIMISLAGAVIATLQGAMTDMAATSSFASMGSVICMGMIWGFCFCRYGPV